MTRASAWVAAAIGFAALTGCTPSESTDSAGSQAATRQAPRCFQASSARNFRMVNSRTAHVRVGRDIYRLDLVGTCQNFSMSNRMRLTTTGSSTVCTGPALGTSLVGRGVSGPQTCSVQRITALTAEEVAALPARDRP